MLGTPAADGRKALEIRPPLVVEDITTTETGRNQEKSEASIKGAFFHMARKVDRERVRAAEKQRRRAEGLGTLRKDGGGQVDGLNDGVSAEIFDARKWWKYDIRRRAHRVYRTAGLDTRLTICGHHDDLYGFVPVSSRNGSLSAHYGHILRCGSVWACPVCGSKIRSERNDEVAEGLRHWLDMSDNHAIAFMTTTIGHDRGETAEAVVRRLAHTPNRKKGETEADHAGAWRRFTRSQAWTGSKRNGVAGFKNEAGIAGYIVVLEATYGLNGWHFHRHTILVLDRVWTIEELDRYRRTLAPVWVAAAEAAGGYADEIHGFDLSLCEYPDQIGNYLVKPPAEALAGEITRGDYKGHSVGLNPWDLLDSETEAVARKKEALGLDEARCAALWLEYVAATKGRHFLDWSKGLRDLLALGEERTDGEIAEADDDEAWEEIAYLSPSIYERGATGETDKARDFSHTLADNRFSDIAEAMGAKLGEWGGLPTIYDETDRSFVVLTEVYNPKEAERIARRERQRAGRNRR